MGAEVGFLGLLTIPAGAQGVSNALQISPQSAIALQMPTAWVAASMQLEFSNLTAPTAADVDWWTLTAQAGDIFFTISANRYVIINGPFMMTPSMWIRARSGNRAAPVNQTGGAIIRAYGWRTV